MRASSAVMKKWETDVAIVGVVGRRIANLLLRWGVETVACEALTAAKPAPLGASSTAA